MKIILTTAMRTGTHWLLEILSDLLGCKWNSYENLADAIKEDAYLLNQIHNVAPQACILHFDKVISITRNTQAVINSRKRFEAHRGNAITNEQILAELRIYNSDFKHKKYFNIKYRNLRLLPIITMRRLADFLELEYTDRELYDIWANNKMGSSKWKKRMYLQENVHGAELL